MLWRVSCPVLALLASMQATAEPSWTVARSAHFEVYSHCGDVPARAALGWFEQLRAFFFSQTTLDWTARSPVRVIGFRSAEEFRKYSTRTAADAYYLGTSGRDTIVMSGLGPDQFRVAAHEYAHVLLHVTAAPIPSWLDEGLADFLSTVHITEKGSSMGGDLPGRSRLLLQERWIPLPELFAAAAESTLRTHRKSAGLFYAESWALAHMLVLSPGYNSRFPALIRALDAGTTASDAFLTVYGKTIEAVAQDAHAWIEGHRATAIAVPGITTPIIDVKTSDVPPLESGLVLAEMLADAGDFDNAEALYRDLDRVAPGNPAIPAGRGAIALSRGDRDRARIEWRRAMELGIADPLLCYQYAILAQEASLQTSEIRAALERAVALRPDFDDARYDLALLEMNHAFFGPAIVQFQAMKTIAPARAYSYWSGLAYCLNEIERRDEAKAAAVQAARYARTPAERAHASELAYFADTDLAVRFTRDANGHQQLVTARAPHGQPDWNPFIEPGDRIRRIEATLNEIVCDAQATRFIVTAGTDRVRLVIPDPSRVQMRHAPPEFTCGPQSPRLVQVEYAVLESKDSDGVVRGVEFR